MGDDATHGAAQIDRLAFQRDAPSVQTIAFEDLRDPYGIRFWPAFKGRDGCRTPMPWEASRAHAGFTMADKSWLPVPYQHANNSIAAAMRAIPLHPGLTRTEADAALSNAVPAQIVRTFLIQNLQFGPRPQWRIGLDEIAAAIDDLEGWEIPDGSFSAPTLFVSGAQSDYVRREHRTVIRALFPAARFVSVKHAGHWLHADNPAGFLSVVEAFLHDWRG